MATDEWRNIWLGQGSLSRLSGRGLDSLVITTLAFPSLSHPKPFFSEGLACAKYMQIQGDNVQKVFKLCAMSRSKCSPSSIDTLQYPDEA